MIQEYAPAKDICIFSRKVYKVQTEPQTKSMFATMTLLKSAL